MPYCPNCGDSVKAPHFYCGQCGFPLSDDHQDETETYPPVGTAATRDGFLSGRSLQYLSELLSGERDLDPDHPGYAHLSRDVAAGLADFATIAAVAEVNLLQFVADRNSNADILGTDIAALTQAEVHERMMWLGLFRIPRLYDRTFGTEWEAQLHDRLNKMVEQAEELTQEEEP